MSMHAVKSAPVRSNRKSFLIGFGYVENDGDADAYCIFISMLCEFAKNQKRINNKPETTDNPKYTMRCYLLRLGMIGAKYKSARKALLRNLSGSSAFRKAANDEVSE